MKSPRSSPPLPLTVPAPLTPNSEKAHLQNLSPMDPNFRPVSVELPCDTLAIGNWRRVRSANDDLRLLVMPATTTRPARLRYLLREGTVYFRLDVPIAALTAVVVSALSSPVCSGTAVDASALAGSLELRIQPSRHVHAAFTFSVCTDPAHMESEDSGWTSCADFTEQEQASRVLQHMVTVHALDKLHTALSDAVRTNELFARLLRLEKAGPFSDVSNLSTQGAVDPDQLCLAAGASSSLPPKPSGVKRRKSSGGRRFDVPEVTGSIGKWALQRHSSLPSPRTRKLSAPTPMQSADARRRRSALPAGFQHQFHINDPADAPVKSVAVGKDGIIVAYDGSRRASLPNISEVSPQDTDKQQRWCSSATVSPLSSPPMMDHGMSSFQVDLSAIACDSSSNTPSMVGNSCTWSSASSITSEEEIMPLSELIASDALAHDGLYGQPGIVNRADPSLSLGLSRSDYALPTYISALLCTGKDAMLSTPLEQASMDFSTGWNVDQSLLQSSPSADVDVCELFLI